MHATESKRAGGYIVLDLSLDNGVWYFGEFKQSTVPNTPLTSREDFTKNHDRTDLFPADEKPYYRKGIWISCAFYLVVVTVCSIALSLLLIRENKNMEAGRGVHARRGAG